MSERTLPADRVLPPRVVLSPSLDASLRRRVHSAELCRYYIDAALAAAGLRRRFWSSELPLWLGSIAVDAVEFVRTGTWPSHPGEAYRAALAAPIRLSQARPYRGYWYEPDTHSLVGLLLALDLNRHEGRYYFLESNMGAALRSERRALYDTDLDPLITNLVSAAKTHAFNRIILLRRFWTEPQLAEFEKASRASGIEMIVATHPTMDTQGHVPVNPMFALSDMLLPRTMYVICLGSVFSPSPIFHFIHNKESVSRWLAGAAEGDGHAGTRLVLVPTSNRFTLPDLPDDPRWPNLVVKIASLDKGRGVAMGRFASEAEARRQLRLRNDIPQIFRLPLADRMLTGLLPQRWEVLYQPFIPPDVVDGCAQTLRTFVFVSPLMDAYLSAHGTVSNQALPVKLPEGLVDNQAAYVVKPVTGKLRRLDPITEQGLREAALEFGRLARLAISANFQVRPDA